MEDADVSRRTLLKGGSAMFAGLSVLQIAGPAQAFAAQAGADDDVAQDDGAKIGPSGEVLPWLDQPADVPPPAQSIVGNLLEWEALDSFRTPSDNFFTVKHYDLPTIDAAQFRLAPSTSRWSARATRVCRSSSAASATPVGRARPWRRS
jgi:hypothetical protein